MKDAKRSLDPAEVSWVLEQKIRGNQPQEGPDAKKSESKGKQ